MLGDYTAGTASLGIDVIENRFTKGADGIWRIREMRIFPIMATDYYQGWARSRLVTARRSVNTRPTSPCPPQTAALSRTASFRTSSSTIPLRGSPCNCPQARKSPVWVRCSSRFAAVRDAMPPPRDMQAAIAGCAAPPLHSVAYIAVDNISHALANDIDHQQWHALGQLFAKDGWRAKAGRLLCRSRSRRGMRA